MPVATCAICGKPTVPEHRPFCSRGCKDRDLVRWLDEGYRLPGAPVIEGEEAPNSGLDSGASDD